MFTRLDRSASYCSSAVGVAEAAGHRGRVNELAHRVRRGRQGPLPAIVQRLPVVAFAGQQQLRDLHRIGGRVLATAGGQDRGQSGHLHAQHQPVSLVPLQRRRRCHLPCGRALQQVGEPVAGGGEQALAGDARLALQRFQLARGRRHTQVALDAAVQALPPGARRAGQQQHSHRQPPADQRVTQQGQQIGGVPPLGVVHHHQHPGRPLHVWDGERLGGRAVTPVVSRQHDPPLALPQLGQPSGHAGLALPARPVDQLDRDLVPPGRPRPGPVPPGPQFLQEGGAAGETDHRSGRPQQLARLPPHRRRLCCLDSRSLRRGPGRPPVRLPALVHDHVPGGLEDLGQPRRVRVLGRRTRPPGRTHRPLPSPSAAASVASSASAAASAMTSRPP